MENKIVTLAELKGEYVRLRDKIEGKGFSSTQDIADKTRVARKITVLESMLLWTILTLMIFISGCYSIHGIGKDLSTWSSPYIENSEK